MDNALYHVMHEGRRLGPFDRRTIVGMRVKKVLASQDVLVGNDGARLTVAHLLRTGEPAGNEPAVVAPVGRTHSVIRGIHPAALLHADASLGMPPFKGELEVRVQTRVLRIAGRFREGLGWREDRVKFALEEVVHARLRGTIVDLGLRAFDQAALQSMSLDLLTRDAAGELAENLSHAAPWPGSEPLAGGDERDGPHPMVWTVVVATALVVMGIVGWVLVRA